MTEEIAGAHILTPQQVRDAGNSLQIVDARTRTEYDAGHIPGAIWMRWEEWCSTAPVPAGSIVRQPGYWGALRDTSAQ